MTAAEKAAEKKAKAAAEAAAATTLESKVTVTIDNLDDFEMAGVKLDGTREGGDGRLYLKKAEWLEKGFAVKSKLKFNSNDTPYLSVIRKGVATAAYFSFAIQKLIEEANFAEGDSLKSLAEVITLAIGIQEDGRLGIQICASGSGDM
jgi:hypothetical protein